MLKLFTYAFVVLCVLTSNGVCKGQTSQVQPLQIEVAYDEQKNISTIRLPTTRISGERERYHSLDFSLSYSYSGTARSLPERINFELVSVVKQKQLNSDLYVVFLVDGKPIHYGSSRSAIPNPVPDRLWTGERMVFQIPYQDLLKMAAAEKLGVRMGSVTFDFNDECRDAVRAFAKAL